MLRREGLRGDVPSDEFGVADVGGLGEAASLADHGGAEVDTGHAALLANGERGQQGICAASAADVQHVFALSQCGWYLHIAHAAEARAQFLRERRAEVHGIAQGRQPIQSHGVGEASGRAVERDLVETGDDGISDTVFLCDRRGVRRGSVPVHKGSCTEDEGRAGHNEFCRRRKS